MIGTAKYNSKLLDLIPEQSRDTVAIAHAKGGKRAASRRARLAHSPIVVRLSEPSGLRDTTGRVGLTCSARSTIAVSDSWKSSIMRPFIRVPFFHHTSSVLTLERARPFGTA